jgi:tetratricopeptide (TPR) repeat protein
MDQPRQDPGPSADHTPRHYLGVTVSSTFTDMKKHRAAVIEAIDGLGMHAVCMERDGAKPGEDLIDSSLRMVREGAGYIGIISRKYGQIPPSKDRNPDALSITELEFNEALELDRPILLFVMDRGHAVTEDDVELDQQKRVKLDAFRERAKRMSEANPVHRIYDSFATYEEFVAKANRAVARLRDAVKPASPTAGDGAKRKPFNLPFATLGELFKGRDGAMEELEKQLRKNGAAAIVQPASITGMGGIGKTRLAIEYALRHEQDFSALLFVSANTPQEIDSNLALLSGPDALGLAECKSGNQPEQYAAVLQWLQENAGWLLIFDNVDTKKAVAVVQALTPRLRKGQVLVTSRIPEWGGAIRALGLDLLSEHASTAYLLEKTADHRQPDPADEAEARGLARDLGLLALALEQAAAYINARSIALPEYRRRWLESSEKLIEFHDDLAIQYPRAVAVTYNTSFEQLSTNGRRLLNILAWLAPEPVPRSLLVVKGGPFAASNEARRPEGEWPGMIEEAEEALADLVRFSLVSWNADKTTFAVHRLVQTVTRRNQPAEEQTGYATTALRWVEAGFIGHPGEVRNWPVLEPLASHVLAVTTEADRREIAEPTTARLINQLGIFYLSRAEWHRAEPLFRRSLVIGERGLGLEHPGLAASLNNLASLLQGTNRLAEAEPLMRRALAIGEKSLGPEHPTVAIHLNNLAELLRNTGRIAEAEPLIRRALAIGEKSLGLEHADVASYLDNLARLLKDTNRPAEAEPIYRRALVIFENSCGPDHPGVATVLNNLARLLQETNRSAEAEPLMRRALAIDEKNYGPDHPEVATDLNNLAALFRDTNRLADAEPLMRRALAITERSLGPDHPNVAVRLNNLASLLQATNRIAEAEPLMRRHLEIFLNFTRSTGHTHPRLETAIGNYTTLLEEMGMSEDQIRARLREIAPERFR